MLLPRKITCSSKNSLKLLNIVNSKMNNKRTIKYCMKYRSRQRKLLCLMLGQNYARAMMCCNWMGEKGLLGV